MGRACGFVFFNANEDEPLFVVIRGLLGLSSFLKFPSLFFLTRMNTNGNEWPLMG